MIDREYMLEKFLEYVQIDSESGHERQMGEALIKDLEALGCSITTDSVGEALPTDGFNIYAAMEGEAGLEPVLFSAHLDTVTPGKGIKPRVCEDGYIRSDGSTILGGDDKAGITAILAAMKAAAKIPHRPLEAVFTVREEPGLQGAAHLDFSRIRSKCCAVLDSTGPAEKVVVGGPGECKIHAWIRGQSSHAGLAPEKGVSAIQAAAHAVAAMKLLRIDEETTANIGVFHAQGPTNIVSEQVELLMEARSRNKDKLEAQLQHMIHCMEEACEKFGAKLSYERIVGYHSFVLEETDPFVEKVFSSLRGLGLQPEGIFTGGGSDANVFNQHGIKAVNLCVGMEKVHSCQEQLSMKDWEKAAELCLELMKA